MGIKYSKYTLNAKKSLNRYNLKSREGCYFSLDDQFFLDYCPWIQFGDTCIDDMIKDISESREVPLLFNKLFELDSYKTQTQFPSFLNHDFNKKNVSNFVKIKCNRATDVISVLNSFPIETQFRLDFNNSLNHSSFLEMFDGIDEELKSRIDYIEDPYVFDEKNWRSLEQLGFNLATDRNIHNEISNTFIYKPGIDLNKPVGTDSKVIYSSYMGSELNTLHTYFSAAQSADLSLRHGIYIPELFTDSLAVLKNIHSDRYTPDKINMKMMYAKLEQKEWTCLI